MSTHHPSGKRTSILFVRLHPEEMVKLINFAAKNGLSRANYARKRLLEEPIPPLPTVRPPIDNVPLVRLVAIYGRVESLVRYCIDHGQINWVGQEAQGNHICDDLRARLNELRELHEYLKRKQAS